MKKIILFFSWTLLSFMLTVGSCYLLTIGNIMLNVSLFILIVFYLILSIKTECFTNLFNKKED
jgi:hypothetical protein